MDAFDKYFQSFTNNLGNSKLRLEEEEVNSCWMDIFFNDQRSPEGIQKSLRTAEVIYKLASFHAVFFSASVFDRAWCLLELTIRRRAGKESLLCSFLDTLESKPRVYTDDHDFFGTMDCWDKVNDLPAIRARVLSIYGSSRAFNRAMHELCAQLRMTYPDGTRYEGKLLFGQRHGVGKLYLRNDAVKYEGAFKTGMYHGRGRLTVYDVRLEGTWKEGELETDGIVRFDDGRTCKRRDLPSDVYRMLCSYERLCIDTSAAVECMLGLGKDRVVTGGADRTLRVWNLGCGECVRVMEGHTHSVKCMTLIEKSRVASGSGDKSIKIWDITTGACMRTLNGHTFTVLALVTLDKTRLVSGSADRTIKVWDTAKELCVKTLLGHTDYVSIIAVLEREKIISGSGDKSLRIWDLGVGVCLKTLGYSNHVSTINLINSGVVLIGSGLRNVEKNCDDTRPRPATKPLMNDSLELWDLVNDRSIKAVKLPPGGVCGVATIDDSRIMTANLNGSISLWDLKSGLGNAMKNIKCHNDRVSCLVLLGDTVVSGSYDGQLKVMR